VTADEKFWTPSTGIARDLEWGKAAEGRRNPRRFAFTNASAIAPASWIAAALWRFPPRAGP